MRESPSQVRQIARIFCKPVGVGQIPSAIHTGYYKRENLHVTHSECNSSQTNHHCWVSRANIFLNKSEVITLHADIKRSWNCLITDISRYLFSADLISSTDFNIFESMSMDLKVMPSSDRVYNYLLVMKCNNSCYIITETLKTRQAK